jgi:hypothetical protein
MKTEVLMKRKLLGVEISQRSKSEFLSATDLMSAGNLSRVTEGLKLVDISQYFKQEKTKEFITELEKEYGQVKISARGRGQQTWVHPLVFMDMALWLSPKLKIHVYKWLQDNLLTYRNNSGDSFKKMAGAIYMNPNFNKWNFQQTIRTVSNRVAIECGVTGNEDRWQKANEEQLKLRDKMQEYIAFACDLTTNLEDAIEIGIRKAKEI